MEVTKRTTIKGIKEEKFTEPIVKITKPDQSFRVKDEKAEEELIMTTVLHSEPKFHESRTIKEEPAAEFELHLPPESKPKDFASESQTAQHRDLECKKCRKTFKFEKFFRLHQCMFACTHCGKTFLRRDNLRQHTTYVHGTWKPSELFTCDHCGKAFKYRKSLVCHMKQHMRDKPLVCGICREGFSVMNTFRQHLLTHGAKKPCKFCGKMLKPSAIYYHIKQTHEFERSLSEGGGRSFKCDTCGAAFKTKSDLSGHKACHNKRFACEFCGRRFSKNYKLSQHLQVHRNPNAFKCLSCNRSYTRKDCLETHMRVLHSAERMQKCAHCDFRTRRKRTMAKHVDEHQRGLKMTIKSCSKCDEMFRNAVGLRNHMAKMHRSTVSCDLCGAEFVSTKEMTVHMQVVHC